jgi:hypothetical protein
MEKQRLQAMQTVYSGNGEMNPADRIMQMENEIRILKKEKEDQAKQINRLQKEIHVSERIRTENRELRIQKREQDRKILSLKRNKARK